MNMGSYFCPRLLDYVVIVGSRHPNRNNTVAQTPELLRRYPLEDHKDFQLPPDVVFFCQPEGCISVGPKRMSLRESTSFVFTLTEKDSGRSRYGICVNFYRSFDRKGHSVGGGRPERHTSIASSTSTSSGEQPGGATLGVPKVEGEDRPKSPRTKRKQKTQGRLRSHTLTSLCIISHHPFFSTFRECVSILRKMIDACNERSCCRRIGGSRAAYRDSVWGVLTGKATESTSSLVMHEVREVETWMLRLLSAPVPVPGKTRVEITVLPKELHPPLIFALPDHTRFSLVDFPLHLPLELLGVEMCMKVLTCIMLEHKLVLQSRDYNALTMSVMAFVSMLYPLEYMFPVIPLLPTCMSCAEQLLLAPTPFIIGVPSSFLMYKKGFSLPNDIWLVDLDANKIIPPTYADEIPNVPEPEGSVLKNHLKQVLEVSNAWYENLVSDHQGIALASMSMSPQPIKNLEVIAQNPDMWKRRESFSSATGFNPLIYGNDVDSVDVATRVAMVRYYNSPNILGNFTEHTRTLRLYPRPVVAFQLNSFIKSRPSRTKFTAKLSRTQAVEYFAEWALSPKNVVYLRVQTGVFDPLLIGDKAKWYSQSLQKIDFRVYDETSSTLGAAVATCLENRASDDNPTDESGSDSDGADSTSSSYSSLSDFVIDIQNSEINGETPVYAEDQILTVDESRVFSPPSQLQVPEVQASTSDSALSAPDSDDGDSSDSSSPEYAKETVEERSPRSARYSQKPESEQYSPREAATPTRRDEGVFRQSPGSTPEVQRRERPPLSPSIRSRDSAYESMGDRQSLTERQMTGSSMGGGPGGGGGVPSPTLLRRGGSERAPMGTREGRSPVPLRRGESETLQRTSSGKIPPQRPPPPVTRTSSLSRGRGVVPGGPPGAGPPVGSPGPGVSAPGAGPNVGTPGMGAGGQGAGPPGGGAAAGVGVGVGAGAGTGPGGDQDLSATSIISSITDDINGFAQSASNTISELFGSKQSMPSSSGSSTPSSKANKPFAPLGNRKALVEKSGLVKHATSQKKSKELQRQSTVDSKASSHSDNQQFLKDIVTSVLEGQGVGWLKLSRVKKLMEDENYRNFVVSRLNTTLDRKLSDEDMHLEDINVSRQVFKGMLSMMKSLITGLEFTYQNQGSGGMASSFMVLEILHTHFWEKEVSGSNKSESSKPSSLASSPFGSRESLSSMATDPKADTRSLQEEHMVAALGSPVVVNGDEYENIELRKPDDPSALQPPQQQQQQQQQQQHPPPQVTMMIAPGHEPAEGGRGLTLTQSQSGAISDGERQRDSSGYGSEPGGDMLRELVKNKELMKAAVRKKNLSKLSSADSDISDGSTLMNLRRKRSGGILGTKSHLSAGFRFHDGKLLNLSLPSPDSSRVYLFEHFIGKERAWLWDQMQFWEDSFLDAIAQERDIIGMDQGPAEMIERYESLGDSEKKRLEQDEDRLLSLMLFNMVSFMVMQRVSKNELRRKVRRMLGKCHIGLVCSQEINNLLDQIGNLHANDIDLKPLGSRMMQKQSFTVHWGADNNGDMLFMEVCDDCLILRSVTGAICDRWWYEKLVNMTYCPKTKVLCLWRRHEGKTQLNKFYTKKCKELYFCVKDSMEKAAARNNGKIPGPELGGEFPVQDLRSGQGGLLQVCMEGIGLLFANSKAVENDRDKSKKTRDFEFFIEISRIKKCFTQKGGIFVLEEFDPKTRKVTQRRYRSSMANSIVLAFLRIIAVHPGLHKKTPKDLVPPGGQDRSEIILMPKDDDENHNFVSPSGDGDVNHNISNGQCVIDVP